MNQQEQSQALKKAAALVESVAGSLDSSQTLCEHCSLSRFNHYGEHRVFVELQSIYQKLQRLASNIERGLNREKVERDDGR